MTWCWLIGHRWVEFGTGLLGDPLVFCQRCRKREIVRKSK